MDIEGAEWDVLSSINPFMLGAFDQIVLEIHNLAYLGDREFADKVLRSLRTLTGQFTLFHVHANNCAGLHIVGGFAVADVLELSFVRTSLVERSPSKTVYPCINKANHPLYHDHALLFYPFLPDSCEKVSDVVRLIAAEEAEVQAKVAGGEGIPW